MTTRDRLRRDLEICLEVGSGDSQADIARRHGVSTRTVRRALMRVGGRVGVGWSMFETRWIQIDATIESLAMRRVEEGGSTAAIEAIRLQADLMVLQVRMLKEAGFLERGSANPESGHFHA
jgi:hypothetical protein